MDIEDISAEIARELGLTGKPSGVVVTNTAYGGAADQAGILRGDVILEVDRKAVKDVEGFYAVVKAKKSYLLRIRRADPQGREVFTVAVLDLK
jgi:serine protease Do